MKNKVWCFRHAKGFTLEFLHKLTGISMSALDKLENGETHDICLSKAVILTNVLQTDLYELFCIPLPKTLKRCRKKM